MKRASVWWMLAAAFVAINAWLALSARGSHKPGALQATTVFSLN